MFLSSEMDKVFIWGCLISFSVLLHTAMSEEEDGSKALLSFMAKLSNNNGFPDPTLGWNSTSDPCKDEWKGITCERRNVSVRKISLNGFIFSGIFDPSTLCDVQSIADSLTMISLNDNRLSGENLEEIANCRHLTCLHISGNQLSGNLPESLTKLKNLKQLDISRNKFYGSVPDLSRISGLTEFLAQNNQLSGTMPNLDFTNLDTFNVSFNNFSGAIPSGAAHLPMTSFINNPQLCGYPLPNKCASLDSESPSGPAKPKSGNSKDQILMFAGYFLIGLVILFFIILWICRKGKKKEEKDVVAKKVGAIDDSINKSSLTTVDIKPGISKSDFSADDSSIVSSSLIVLTNPEVNGLRFENLLKAPAELLGRGKYGSVYKVIYEDLGMTLAVKRIRDWTISSSDFKQRMQRLNQVKHPNVLPPIAFYSTRQEKLLVYEYQQNGSLFKLIHGTGQDQYFDWSSRLYVAASVADALAFMHQELHQDRIAHGNLKSSNILLNKNLEPTISEYGLMVVDNEQDQSLGLATDSSRERDDSYANFKADIYAFGVILLELLTGKLVMINGKDLASWVLSAVREEWTVEVFDRSLIQEGASEERMVHLLQIAIKCVNRSPEARPGMNRVAFMINKLKEEEEKSMDLSEPLTS